MIENTVQEEGLCGCRCHKHEGTLHILPCCKLTYKVYIGLDGKISNEPWIQAKKEYNEWVDKTLADPNERKMNKKGLLETKFKNPDETIGQCLNRCMRR